eukprot:1785769-Alexandrium_andersonii.AAC.1
MQGADDVPWELETAALTTDYAALEVTTQAGPLAAVPVALDGDGLVVAIPAEAAPWLPSLLVPLADPDTGEAAVDGAHCTVTL